MSTSHSPELSRRTSSSMGPPPVPANSSLPSSPRPLAANVAEASSATLGPIRHPRPLTAAELHLELEKEQESIVNRLTRELSALRAQTASVASTTSSTSELFSSQNLPEYPYPFPYQAGTGTTIIPSSARRHRSSSNLSARSARSVRDSITTTARDATATSVSGVAAPREALHSHSHQTSSRPSMEIIRDNRPEMSRQNSLSGYRSTSATSQYLAQQQHPASYGQVHRTSVSGSSNNNPTTHNMGIHQQHPNAISRSPSFNSAIAAARYEEAALQRSELEAVKRENETLKSRIRELEKTLQHGSTDEYPAPTSAAANGCNSTSS